MGSNLRADWNNHYFEVVEPFVAYVLVAHVESNTFVGRSQAFGRVWQPVELSVGAEIRSLVGGEFAAQVGAATALPTRIALCDKHLFEHGAGDRPQHWPMQNLVEVARPGPAVISNHACTPRWSTDDLHAACATSYGRSIDWVLPAPC